MATIERRFHNLDLCSFRPFSVFLNTLILYHCSSTQTFHLVLLVFSTPIPSSFATPSFSLAHSPTSSSFPNRSHLDLYLEKSPCWNMLQHSVLFDLLGMVLFGLLGCSIGIRFYLTRPFRPIPLSRYLSIASMFSKRPKRHPNVQSMRSQEISLGTSKRAACRE